MLEIIAEWGTKPLVEKRNANHVALVNVQQQYRTLKLIDGLREEIGDQQSKCL